MTPSNPEAFAKIPAGLQPYAVNSKENIDKVIFNDPVWWAEKGGDAVNAFLDAIERDAYAADDTQDRMFGQFGRIVLNEFAQTDVQRVVQHRLQRERDVILTAQVREGGLPGQRQRVCLQQVRDNVRAVRTALAAA